MEHKEATLSFILYHLAARQFFKINTTLQRVHMEGGFFYQGWKKGGYENGAR